MKLSEKEVKKFIKKFHKNGILSVLDGTNEEGGFSSDWLTPDEFYDILRKRGVDWEQYESDTNGWQYDYFHRIEHNGKSYFFQYCGFYGGASFSEEE